MATTNGAIRNIPIDSGEQAPVELWVDRLVFSADVTPGHRVVKGTTLGAETLVAEMATGLSDEDLLRVHPELTVEDVTALRHYARLPEAIRLTFGSCEGEAEDLDKFLELRRQLKKLRRKEVSFPC